MDVIDRLYPACKFRYRGEAVFAGFLNRVHELTILLIQAILVPAFPCSPTCRYRQVNFSAEAVQWVPVGTYRILYGVGSLDIPIACRSVQAGVFVKSRKTNGGTVRQMVGV